MQGSGFLRSDTADTASGDITFTGGAGAITIGTGSDGSDIRFVNGTWTGDTTAAKIQLHSNYLYIAGGSNGIIFRENSTNRWIIDGSGHLDPATNSTYDIGASGTRVRNGYFDNLYGSGANITAINASNISSGTISDARLPSSISSDITGNAATATTSTRVTVTDNSSDTSCFVLFAQAATGNQLPHSGSNLTFNASSGLLTATSFSGNGANITNVNATTLDSIDSGSFVRSDSDDTLSAVYTFSSGSQDVINFSNASGNDNRGIAFNGRTALSADHNDGYLRLNNNQEFSNGVYTPLVMRADGGFNVDGTTVINGSGNIAYSRLTGTPTIPSNNNQLTNGAGYITSASFSDVAGGGTFTGDISLSGGAAAMTVNAGSDIRFTNGDWTGNTCKIQHHSNRLYIVGGSSGIIFREGGNDRAKIDGNGHFCPATDNTYTLGTSSLRWQDVYTNDLHLSNKGHQNKVDNSWGDYTIQEGADDLFIINNRNGKMFKFMLQEVK